MMKYFKTTVVMLLLVVCLCSFAGLMYSSQPPEGYTGADGSYCVNCHYSYALNNPGGNVVVSGLPENGYTAGTAYSFSITTTHSAADRKRWGFEITARNSQNEVVGSFSTTNANAAINGNELAHNDAVVTSSQSSFTYENLTWTAPVNPGENDQNITFYFVGNAANGNGSTSEDYIYSGTKVIHQLVSPTYTFSGNGNWDNPANWSNNTLPPANLTGDAKIIIDPPVGGECVLNVVQHIGNTATFTVNTGKKFRIIGDLIINN